MPDANEIQRILWGIIYAGAWVIGAALHVGTM